MLFNPKFFEPFRSKKSFFTAKRRRANFLQFLLYQLSDPYFIVFIIQIEKPNEIGCMDIYWQVKLNSFYILYVNITNAFVLKELKSIGTPPPPPNKKYEAQIIIFK